MAYQYFPYQVDFCLQGSHLEIAQEMTNASPTWPFQLANVSIEPIVFLKTSYSFLSNEQPECARTVYA